MKYLKNRTEGNPMLEGGLPENEERLAYWDDSPIRDEDERTPLLLRVTCYTYFAATGAIRAVKKGLQTLSEYNPLIPRE